MTGRRRSKAEERAHADLLPMLQHLELIERSLKLEYDHLKATTIPAAWSSIEKDVPTRPRKVRVTAAYDADVAGFFRAMGQGYQARMNAVLRAYMLAVQSRVIASRKNQDWMGNEI